MSKEVIVYYTPEQYAEAVAIVRSGRPSTSYLSREMKIGLSFASALIERMETEGVVSKANHIGKREIL